MFQVFNLFRRKRHVDTQIVKLENIVSKRKALEKQQLYLSHKKVFEIILNFIKDQQLLVYGGRAINAILPKDYRFYEKYDLPDVDFFSFKAKEHAIELSDILRSHGYKYVEVRSGIHYETFKLFVDFNPVADITDIPKRLFDRMKMMAQNEKKIIRKYAPDCKIPVAPLTFLRLSMHIEFSRPDGYIERWTKIFRRLRLLYEYYPVSYTPNCTGYEIDNDTKIVSLHKILLKEVIQQKLPLFGIDALKMYLKKGGLDIPNNAIIHPKMTLIDVIAKKHVKVANELRLKLKQNIDEKYENIILKHHAPLNSSEILPKHIILYYVRVIQGKKYIRPLIGIYNSVACYSYKTIDNIRIGSIDTILSFMYAWLLSDRVYFKFSRIECLLSWLLNVQNMYLEDNSRIFDLFEKKCYGHQIDLTDKKKQMWNKPFEKIVYRPSF